MQRSGPVVKGRFAAVGRLANHGQAMCKHSPLSRRGGLNLSAPMRLLPCVFGLLLLFCGGKVREEVPEEVPVPCTAMAPSAFWPWGLSFDPEVLECFCKLCDAEIQFCFENPELCAPIRGEWVVPGEEMIGCARRAFEDVCPEQWGPVGGASG